MDMETPQISRSGRVLKKSAKVKEMEDFDINDLDVQGKARKKARSSDDFDEFDDKRVAPIKIPKLSIGSSPQVKRPQQSSPKSQMPSVQKVKQQFYDDSSGDGSKESDSSSMSSESSSSSSSSDDSDSEASAMRPRTVMQNIQHQPNQHDKVIVESYRRYESPVSFDTNDMSMDGSEDEGSDSALVIAEESSDSFMVAKGQKMAMNKKKAPPVRKAPVVKKKPAPRSPAAAKKEKTPGKSKPLTAYMLWCTENRKRIAAASGITAFGSIGKKLGEAWQALPDKEKMAWRRKAKRLALKNASGLISTGPSPPPPRGTSAPSAEDALRNMMEGARTLGTGAIDSAAYLKLLGDSLSVIGQRLTEHEGQLAVSGIFSVLLDTILCAVAPLLCLTSESPLLNSLPQDTSRKTLDSIAYFMPGL